MPRQPFEAWTLTISYDKGYVIQAGDYSSLVAQATYATEASSPSSTAYPSTTSPRGSTPSAAPSSSRPSSNVASQQYNLTGGLSNLVQQDFASGVCNFYYFSAISPEYGFCIGSGSAIFPSSECSGTSCTIDASTPKLGWGLAGDLSLPSSLVCDGVVHTVAEGLDIGVAINAGKGSDPFYVSHIVNCPAECNRRAPVMAQSIRFPISVKGCAARE